MQTGIVKWFNNKKGFGFIIPDQGGNDLFVHHSDIQMTGFRSLKDGQKVKYTVTEGNKGLQATSVEIE